ncbi:hypothetical protein T4B_14448 [Trichinella pseudospiralis]|uniref:Uncharacterized protein n=1 Tax=Trichinella pseudospiralis TaxID=6337 RepID=A0A0V1IRI1_TRIPS|nr:hypothetical protein T4B_14448 [Trichinella pseudospiralis]
MTIKLLIRIAFYLGFKIFHNTVITVHLHYADLYIDHDVAFSRAIYYCSQQSIFRHMEARSSPAAAAAAASAAIAIAIAFAFAFANANAAFAA